VSDRLIPCPLCCPECDGPVALNCVVHGTFHPVIEGEFALASDLDALRAENERLRAVVEAAKKFMRYNGSGPGSVYDASRAYVYGKQLNAALAALDQEDK